MQKRILLSATLVGLLGASTLTAHRYMGSTRSHLHGTSIFHRFLRVNMTYAGQEEIERPPLGTVSIRHNKQGKANNQRLSMWVRRLEPKTNYYLLAWFGDEGAGYTEIASFQPNAYGTAIIRHKKIGSSKGLGNGHEKFLLPEKLDPVDAIHTLAIAQKNDQDEWEVLLEANLLKPDRLHYLVKRQLDNPQNNTEAEGVLFLRANHRTAWFRLDAAGLDPDTEYFLVLNNAALEDSPSVTADDQGLISIRTTLDVALNILEVQSLELRDAEDTAILRTTFPSP